MTINLQIDGMKIQTEEGKTVFEAAQQAGIKIPTLCWHKDLCVSGNCRVCVVEKKGSRNLIASCATPIEDGMEIQTSSFKVRQARKHVLSLLLSEHRNECNTCIRNKNCELQTLSSEYVCDDDLYISVLKQSPVDCSSLSIQKDDTKCIRCTRCVRTCANIQKVGVFTAAHKGKEQKIDTFLGKSMMLTNCTNCGQCINRCPTGALSERNQIEEVWNELSDQDSYVVVQTAPSVRVALGEALGSEPGKRVTGKMVTALKIIGFDSVLDTDFAADLTIMEEAHELLDRLKKSFSGQDVTLPMTTSCSPGWVKFIEHEFPDLLKHLSTCKSPQQMFGAIAKTYYAQKIGVDPSRMKVVAIMPCTAKKFESMRPEMRSSGYQDVDYVLTTREFSMMIKQAGINFDIIEESVYDSLLGESTGAGVIFGATGGVMEAALRTAYEVITGRPVPFDNLNITAVRGFEGIREAVIKIEGCVTEWAFLEGVELKVAVAHGLANAAVLMEQVRAGQSPYHFIEIMACPGGCLGGGGQPIPTNVDIRIQRMRAIYEEDGSMKYRKSHENPEIKALYTEFLKEPLGKLSHKLLHTGYTRR